MATWTVLAKTKGPSKEDSRSRAGVERPVWLVASSGAGLHIF